ncbi:type III-A CRISPR-associated protein Csm2 [Anoxybacter fermentans]|uniref:CRISPR system Cms protein Csm2 n=1 Tax=Anoxybacter fermentans TaxID=1323375 RepID=A0A3Q9HQL7_9FIRM|nr:type III-A CRISPR-associated protein Csm2 [Anoxybacter fermentans]AZR72422.1 type III-A CRISPR-associated protein Csm2 [Anoxybacter fermentans]
MKKERGKTKYKNDRFSNRNELINYFKNVVLDLDNADYDEFCEKVKKYAEQLRPQKYDKTNKVTTSMIRKVYNKIMNAKSIIDLKMLRPQFAYLAGRNEKNVVLKEFIEMLDSIVKSLRDQKQLVYFQRFMEAIVAYRKYVGDDE